MLKAVHPSIPRAFSLHAAPHGVARGPHFMIQSCKATGGSPNLLAHRTPLTSFSALRAICSSQTCTRISNRVRFHAARAYSTNAEEIDAEEVLLPLPKKKPFFVVLPLWYCLQIKRAFYEQMAGGPESPVLIKEDPQRGRGIVAKYDIKKVSLPILWQSPSPLHFSLFFFPLSAWCYTHVGPTHHSGEAFCVLSLWKGGEIRSLWSTSADKMWPLPQISAKCSEQSQHSRSSRPRTWPRWKMRTLWHSLLRWTVQAISMAGLSRGIVLCTWGDQRAGGPLQTGQEEVPSHGHENNGKDSAERKVPIAHSFVCVCVFGAPPCLIHLYRDTGSLEHTWQPLQVLGFAKQKPELWQRDYEVFKKCLIHNEDHAQCTFSSLSSTVPSLSFSLSLSPTKSMYLSLSISLSLSPYLPPLSLTHTNTHTHARTHTHLSLSLSRSLSLSHPTPRHLAFSLSRSLTHSLAGLAWVN